MPRIPAAIAVVMLVATCIGFNTARFPVVLEMAAVPEASSSTRVVVCAESTGDSTGSGNTTGTFGADTHEDAKVSSSGYRSSWSSYGNDDSEEESGYGSYSYGSHRSHGKEKEELNESKKEESSSKYSSSSYGSSYASNRYSSGKSLEEEDSTGEDASDTHGGSNGYSDENSSWNKGSSSSKNGYGGYGSEDSSNQDDSASANRNRRNKNRAKSDTYGSGGNSGKSQATPAGDETETGNDYSWNNSSRDESNEYSGYDSYGSGKSGSNRRDSYSQSDSHGGQDSAEDWGSKSAGSYDDNSSFNNDRSPTRYGERQEAAADDSSTWPGGEPAAASPSGPYAYDSPSYEDSVTASAGAAPASSNLGLVPVEEERRPTESWGYTQSDGGYGGSSVSTGYSAQNRSVVPSPPPGFTPLPPVDRSVGVPAFSPLTGESIPVYPSTGAM